VLGLFAALRLIPWGWAPRVGRVLGPLLFALDGRHRRIARINLELAFGSDLAKLGGVNRVLRGVYVHMVTLVIEIAHMFSATADEVRSRVSYEGLEAYQAVRASGRPVVILTGHVGNFDLMALAHSAHGHPLSFLARPMDNPLVYEHLNRMRRRFGNDVLDKKGSGKDAFRVLRSGGVLGILGDQNATREEGDFVEFFGTAACTHVSIAKLALKTQAAIVPAFIARNRDGSHTIHVGPPIEPTSTGHPREDALATTQEVARVTEQIIRRFPEQWLWGHRRWKTRPHGESKLY
jgi:KDO2-lipid IV(A) lauroyltransferase